MPSPDVTDAPAEAELERRLAQGDRAAATLLVERTYRRIFGALVKLCDGDRELAADLTQETYRKAWQNLPSFRGESSFVTWVYRIAFNTALNARRRPRPVSLDEPGTGFEERLVDSEPDPEAWTARRLEDRRLRHAVAQLPEPLRFTVTARYWAGLSSPEIARLENVSSVAIRKRLMRALALVETWLVAHGFEFDDTKQTSGRTDEESSR